MVRRHHVSAGVHPPQTNKSPPHQLADNIPARMRSKRPSSWVREPCDRLMFAGWFSCSRALPASRSAPRACPAARPAGAGAACFASRSPCAGVSRGETRPSPVGAPRLRSASRSGGALRASAPPPLARSCVSLPGCARPCAQAFQAVGVRRIAAGLQQHMQRSEAAALLSRCGPTARALRQALAFTWAGAAYRATARSGGGGHGAQRGGQLAGRPRPAVRAVRLQQQPVQGDLR